MTRAPIDDAARRRIREDLDANLCIEAGAGTGKTTVLVDRVIALLRGGHADIDHVAVITFTEKAAGELAARIRFELEQAADHASGEEHARLAAALEGLHRARIQTIHAFAAGVLRERPVEAHLDPAFETLDSLAAGVLFDNRYDAWLDELLAVERPEVTPLLEAGFKLNALRRMAERHAQAGPAMPLKRHSLTAIHELVAWAAEVARDLAAMVDGCANPEDKLYPMVRELAVALKIAVDDTVAERPISVDEPKVNLGCGSAASWGGKEGHAAVKDAVRAARTAWERLATVPRTRMLLELLPHAERFAEELAEARRTEGAVDFDDILVRARNLVRNDQHVRRFLHRRTTRILVDEFQDTDAVQAELIVRIAAAPDNQPDDWRDVRPAPGRLVVVGDPKQSIYRFRNADIAVYDEVKTGPLKGDVELLVQNFRSTPGVLAFANQVFNRVLEERPLIQAPNIELKPYRDSVVDGPCVNVARPAEPPDDRVAATADLLARTIRTAVVEERWPIYDPRSKTVRDVDWRDVAILVPARGEIELLEASLTRHGIPFRNESGRGYYQRTEVRELIALLHAIDDPTDAIAVVATLRSLAFGVSDDDLVLHRLAGGRWDPRNTPPADGPTTVAEALAVIADLHRARRGLSLGELVRTAVERTGMVETALALRFGEAMAANLLKLVDEARSFATSGGGALRSFTTWLARRRDEDEDAVPDAPVAEERDQRVRIMTVHAAKGLEFGIVALGNVEHAGGNPDQYRVDPRAHLLHQSFGSNGDRFATPGWYDVYEQEKIASTAERERLLYVAVTRARDHLIFPDASGGEPKGHLERLAPDLPEHSTDIVRVLDPLALSALADTSPGVDDEAGPDAIKRAEEAERTWTEEHERVRRAASAEIRLTTATGVRADPRPLAAIVSGLGSAEELASLDIADAPPLDLGEALHRALELVDLPDGDNLQAVAEAACFEAGVPAVVDAVIAMARGCIGSDVVARAAAAPGGPLREVPFTVITDDQAAVGSGRIDLLFREDNELVVVDYKSDDVEPEDVAEHVTGHRAQAAVYACAAEQATGLPVREIVFVFARAARAVAVPVAEELRAEGRELLKSGRVLA